jgi:hypothetical protein
MQLQYWIECKPFVRDGGIIYTPFTPCKKAVFSNKKPGKNFLGPYHCADCAEVCASFGFTEERAREFNHGTDDEKFGAGLGWC